MDPQRLIELMLAADFTWTELRTLAWDHLERNLDAELNQGGIEERIVDLVAWADRQGMIKELTAGVLKAGASKRGLQTALLSEAMQNNAAQGESYTLLRLETKVDRVLERQESIIAEQADLKRRMGTVETMAQTLHMRQSPTIDRVMVALLAVAMLGMLAFNVVAIR